MSTAHNYMEFPLVSVFTLVYNTGRYVLESFECVKRQKYPNIEHIIVDDFSTDDSAEIVDNWIKKNNYPCRYIRHEKNIGVQKSLEEVFSLITGKYFVTISDDLWSDNTLIDQVALFEKLDDSYAMVYGDSNMIDKEGRILIPSMFAHYRGAAFIPPSGDIFREVVTDFYFFIQASIIRLEHFKKMNYTFDNEIISQDWDWQLWLSRNYNILGVKEIYASYRWLETSIGRTNWTKGKMHNVLLSQAKMLLNYYNHPRNDRADRRAIYDRVKNMYIALASAPNATKEQKEGLLKTIFKITHNRKIYLAIIKNKLLKKMSIKSRIKKAVNFFGIDIIRHLPPPISTAQKEKYYRAESKRFGWLREYDVKTIIDVGANEGQFTGKILNIFPQADVHCFEPLKDAYEALKQYIKNKPNVHFYNKGLGEEDAELEIFKNEYSPSSSLLEMLDMHKTNFDHAVEVTPEKISIRKLDDFFPDKIRRSLLVKIDVQGYEMYVLKGGSAVLEQADIVIIETSFYPLYKGQPLFNEIYDYFKNIGFKYAGNIEQLNALADNKILQADAVFIKNK